jgi:hypothetical protein
MYSAHLDEESRTKLIHCLLLGVLEGGNQHCKADSYMHIVMVVGNLDDDIYYK